MTMVKNSEVIAVSMKWFSNMNITVVRF